jgi:DNA-binding transcriptional MerR regulator
VRASDMRDGSKRGKKAVIKGGYTRVSRPPRQPKGPPPPKDNESDRTPTDGTDVGNALAHGSPPDMRNWLTRAEASRRIGVSKNTLIRWEKEGDVEFIIDDQGFHRFNPEDIDVLAEGRSTDATQMMGQSVAMVVQTSTDLTQKAQDHAQRFADKHLQQSDIAFEQMRLMVSEIREENVSLRTYIRELETERREKNKEIEEAQTKVHLRRLDEMKQQTSDRRVDWALNALTSIAGPALMAKLDIPPANIPTLGTGQPGQAAQPGTTPVALPPGPKPEETADEYLRRLETNCIILIANIDEQRFKLLCHVATAEEVAALTEVRTVVQRLREQQKAS